jgi:hypothetical protein
MEAAQSIVGQSLGLNAQTLIHQVANSNRQVANTNPGSKTGVRPPSRSGSNSVQPKVRQKNEDKAPKSPYNDLSIHTASIYARKGVDIHSHEFELCAGQGAIPPPCITI